MKIKDKRERGEGYTEKEEKRISKKVRNERKRTKKRECRKEGRKGEKKREKESDRGKGAQYHKKGEKVMYVAGMAKENEWKIRKRNGRERKMKRGGGQAE